jgi:hypothetical protein
MERLLGWPPGNHSDQDFARACEAPLYRRYRRPRGGGLAK